MSVAPLEEVGTHVLPRVLPAGWTVIAEDYGGRCYRSSNGLAVIASAHREADGKRWLHVSVSRRSRLPDWDDLVAVKNIFIGPHRLAVQVLPPQEKYVNINPNVLHLWCCLDGDPVPDFAGARGGQI